MTSAETLDIEIQRYVERPFGLFAELVGMQARANPDKIALICGEQSWTYRQLDDRADRIASGLERDGVGAGGVVAVCAAMSTAYVATFLGVLRTGAAVSPLAPSATPEQLLSMLDDSGAPSCSWTRWGRGRWAGPDAQRRPAHCVGRRRARPR